jgi:hypothetical protein
VDFREENLSECNKYMQNLGRSNQFSQLGSQAGPVLKLCIEDVWRVEGKAPFITSEIGTGVYSVSSSVRCISSSFSQSLEHLYPCQLLTVSDKILNYLHVLLKLISLNES